MQGQLNPQDVAFEAMYVRTNESLAATTRAIQRVEGRVDVRGIGTRPTAVLVRFPRRLSLPAAWSRARRLREALVARRLRGVFVDPMFEVTGRLPRETPSKKALTAALSITTSIEDHEWSVKRVRAHQAWDMAHPHGHAGGHGVMIGHPDTGYTEHPEIWDATIPRRLKHDAGLNLVEPGDLPRDRLRGMHPGHGTSTASVIMSGAGGGAPSVSGVAPRATLIPYRVATSVIQFSFGRLIEAIRHAVDTAEVHIISISLGGAFPSAALEKELARAYKRGVVLLAAAGQRWPWVVYPARYSEVIAVAATTIDDEPWRHSSSGAVDVSAPGENVWRAAAARAGDEAKYTVAPSSGTSYAVATAAGAAALWLAHHGGSAALAQRLGGSEQIPPAFRRALLASARAPDGWDPQGPYGAGIVDCERLLRATVGAPEVTSPALASVRSARTPVARTVERGLAMFPPKDWPLVRPRLQKLAQARDVADELLFQLAIDKKFRSSLVAPAKGTKKTSSITELMLAGVPKSGAATPSAKLAKPIAKYASPALRARLREEA